MKRKSVSAAFAALLVLILVFGQSVMAAADQDDYSIGAAAALQAYYENEAQKDTTTVTTRVRSLNIRAEASTDSDIVGKLFRGGRAESIERKDGWTHIVSGDVNGWVRDDFIFLGEDAVQSLTDNNPKVAVVSVANLRVRECADVSSDVIGLVSYGTELFVSEIYDEWIEVYYTGVVNAYVSREFVSIEEHPGTALSKAREDVRVEEVNQMVARQAQEAAEREAARIAAAQQQQQQTYTPPQNTSNNSGSRDNSSSQQTQQQTQQTQAPVSASYDDVTLVAAICDLEATGYEAQLAVASVIVNRLYSGLWGSTISSVIYAPGQFYGSNSGILANKLANGPSSTARQAAQDALNGANNVGDYLYFMSSRSAGDCSQFSSYVNIGGNVFYRR